MRFLVVEPQMLVQLDLAESLAEVVPDADIVAVSSIAAAESAIARWDDLTGAVIGAEARDFCDSRLAHRIRALGGWIICLGDVTEAPVEAEGYAWLPRPVFSDDLRHTVRTLLTRDSRPAAC